MRGADMERVIFDTDIGGDPDDALALIYLLREPRCELLGVTTVSGDPSLKAEIASALCWSLGRKDVPVFAGGPTAPRQSTHCAWRDELAKWPHCGQPSDVSAIDFMRRVIHAHPGEVTLLSTAPFTNVAALFASAPEAPSLLKQLVVMGGHFGGECEYNAFSDIAATKAVFEGGGLPPPPELVAFGADATTSLSMSPDEGRRFMAQSPDFAFVRGWHAERWYERIRRLYFHDPIAAVSLFHPEIADYGMSAVCVDENDKARTSRVAASGQLPWLWHIAGAVDYGMFLERYCAVLGTRQTACESQTYTKAP